MGMEMGIDQGGYRLRRHRDRATLVILRDPLERMEGAEVDGVLYREEEVELIRAMPFIQVKLGFKLMVEGDDALLFKAREKDEESGGGIKGNDVNSARKLCYVCKTVRKRGFIGIFDFRGSE